MLRKRKSLFLVGISLSWLTVGCQFGNQSKIELSGYDTISGYYETYPQSVVFTSRVGSAPERTTIGTIHQIPPFAKVIFANPTFLFFDSPTEGIGSIRANADRGFGIVTRIQDRAGTFGASSRAQATLPGCLFIEEMIHTGNFAQNPGTIEIQGFPVRGRLNATFSLTYRIEGDAIDCDPVRAQFLSCYKDGTNCSTSSGSIFSQSFLNQIFDPFVQAGSLQVNEIATLHEIKYETRYE